MDDDLTGGDQVMAWWMSYMSQLTPNLDKPLLEYFDIPFEIQVPHFPPLGEPAVCSRPHVDEMPLVSEGLDRLEEHANG